LSEYLSNLRTELDDITQVEYRQLRLERVVLVSVWTTGTAEEADAAMAELSALADTAGAVVVDKLIQRREQPDRATYVGKGKVEEVKDVVVATGADTVICDGELSPAQLRNLEDRWDVKVVDRTTLILDIFAQHAKSVEGKTQVELAQLNYMRQRLRGWGDSLSRQVGGRAAGVLVSVDVVPVRPRSRRTGAASTHVRRCCGGGSRRWRPHGRSAARPGSATRCRRWR